MLKALSLIVLGVTLPATVQVEESSTHKDTLVYIALPTEPTTNILPALEAAEDTFKGLNKNDRFVAIDSSTASVLTTIDICAHTECSSERVMIRKHRSELEKAFGPWRNSISKNDVDPTTVPNRLIRTLHRIGDMQAGSAKPAHALIISSPIHIDTADPALSMLRQDGVLYFPSKEAFSRPSTQLIYGQGGRGEALRNVYVTLCATVPAWVADIDREKFKSIWATYIRAGGGNLVGYFDDMESCIDSFRQRPTTAIAVQPLEKYSDTSGKSIKPIVEYDVDDFGAVSKQDVKITVTDHNTVLDDAYSLYVNERHVGDVANVTGGRSSFPVTLQGGENIIELRVKKDRGQGTYMRVDIEPGGFSRTFTGTKTHTYQITAPTEETDAMIPMDRM